MDEFQLVICYSEYVRGWVRRYWNREAVVVNPPIDRPVQEPHWELKQPSILSVGRFFAGGHSKRHDLMVMAFRRLCDEGLRGWRLDLAGSVHRDAQHAGYLESVAALAQGYPITIHADVSGPALADLYARASLYWHAAGAGADEAQPEQQEHFGMTVVEGMGHGVVPLVHHSGGLPEIVHDGVDGFCWQDLDQLCQLTLQLTADSSRWRTMGEAARASSARFTRASFKAAMKGAVKPLIDLP